jgi:hypothetical protein
MLGSVAAKANSQMRAAHSQAAYRASDQLSDFCGAFALFNEAGNLLDHGWGKFYPPSWHWRAAGTIIEHDAFLRLEIYIKELR